MLKSKKILMAVLSLAFVVILAACGGGDAQSSTAASTDTSVASAETSTEATTGGMTGTINPVSREDGSGTRGAFVEITGVEDESGDRTAPTAAIMQGTDEVITFVKSDPQSIGYISLGSLNDTVKAVKVDGVDATDELIKAGEYPLARPLNIVYKEGSLSDVAQDFHDFIFSKEGQEIASDGYIAVDDAAAPYAGAEGLTGKITVEGSTSVAPLMEKLIEAYNVKQPGVSIEVTANGSGPGVTAATEGTTDIGMASRELKAEESAVVKGEPIARDGIAVIVNNENPVSDLSMETIMKIFIGEVTSWDGL